MMMEIAGYMLCDALAGALFLIAVCITYRLMLARSGRLALNRAVLVMVLIVALLILPVSVLMGAYRYHWPVVSEGPIFIVGAGSFPKWLTTVVMIYAAGAGVALLLQLAGHLRSLLLLAGAKRKVTPWGTVMVSRRRKLIPFCWMGYVVVGSDDADNANGMILTHEHIHASSKHWADLLIGGIVAAINWFNPAVWLLLEDLKRVHEFQADRGVIRSGADEYEYQMLLIKRSAPRVYRYAFHSFNGGALRSRIEMMIKPRRGRRYGLRIALLAGGALISIAAAAESKTLKRTMEDIRIAVQVYGTGGDVIIPEDTGKPVITINGKPAPEDVLKDIDPKTIDHITIDKTKNQNGTIMIELKK